MPLDDHFPPVADIPLIWLHSQRQYRDSVAEMNRHSFSNSVARNIALIPRPALGLMFGIAAVFALVDVADWAFHWGDVSTALWSIAPYVLLVTIAEYLAITGVIGTQPSVAAYLRFSAAWGAVLIPTVVAIGLLFSAPLVGKNGAILLFAVGVVVAIALVAFLPAWPVAQAMSSSFVPPMRILRATRGFRSGLVGMALVLGALNRQDLIPTVKDAHDLGHAFGYAAGEAGINTLSFVYAAAVAATAYIFAARNDEGLYPPGPSRQSLTARRKIEAEADQGRSETQNGGGANMFWKGLLFWIVVLIGLTMLLAFVPATNSIPQYIIAAVLVAIVLAFTLTKRRRPSA